MVPGKQALPASVNPPEPVLIDVLRLPDLRVPWKGELVRDAVGGEVRPEGLHAQADAAVGREEIRPRFAARCRCRTVVRRWEFGEGRVLHVDG